MIHEKLLSHSSSQDIFHLLWNLKTHYYVHKILLLDPTLSQTCLVHIIILYFFMLHFNVILPSVTRSSRWSLLFRFLHKYFMCISCFSTPHPSYSSQFNHPKKKIKQVV